MSMRPEAAKNFKIATEGLQEDSIALEPSAEAAVWKAPSLYTKEIHLLIPKHLLEEQGPGGILSRDERSGGTILSSPSALRKLGASVLYSSSAF